MSGTVSWARGRVSFLKFVYIYMYTSGRLPGTVMWARGSVMLFCSKMSKSSP
jgi:hypothetical protein